MTTLHLGDEWPSTGITIPWLPMFLRKYLRYVKDTEPAPIHHIGSALSIASVAAGGLTHVEYGSKKVVLNTYIVNIAPSGGRKTEAFILAMQLFNTIRDQNPLTLKPPMPDITSNTAIMQAADQRGDMVVSVLIDGREKRYTQIFLAASEFAALLRTRDKDITTFLTTIFDGATSSEYFEYRTQMGGSFQIIRPYVVLFMGSTLEWLADRVPQGAREGGFLYRILFFWSEQFSNKAFPQSSPDIGLLKEDLEQTFLALSQKSSTITWTPQAQDYFADWYQSTRGGILTEPFAELQAWTSRLGIFIIKLAGLSAFMDNRIYIQPKDLDFAYSIMHFARIGALASLKITGANKDSWLELQLIKSIIQSQTKTGVHPSLPASFLCRRFSSDASAFKIRQILESLADLGILIYDKSRDRVAAKLPQAQDYLREPKAKDYDLTWDQISDALQEPNDV